MAKISKYFTVEEVQCRCGKCKIPKDVMSNLVKLTAEMDVLREKIGKPIYLSCAYRCLEHNRKIGSEDTSQHVKGLACDFYVKGMTEEEMFKFASNLSANDAGKKRSLTKFNGVGYYPNRNFCHVDIRPKKVITWRG